MEKPIKIFIVDDHPIVVEGLSQLIKKEKNMKICGSAGSVNSAISEIRSLRPHIVIVDIALKGGVSGLELIRAVKERFPSVTMLALSMHDESLYAERAIRAGARGYVMKDQMTQTVVKAIKQVMEGRIYLSEKIASNLLDGLLYNRTEQIDDPVKLLSNRELEVFQLIGQGYRTMDIARELNLSKKTIDTHRHNLKDKLNIDSSVELVRYAVQWKNDS